MDTKQPNALRLADALGRAPKWQQLQAAAELRRQHAEIETLRAGYDAAKCSDRKVVKLDARIKELEAQLDAIGAGGVEPLRKREEKLCQRCTPVCQGGEGCFAGMPQATQVRMVAFDVQPERKRECQPQEAAPVAQAVPAEARQLHGDARLAHDQCRAVVSLANSVAEVYAARAAIVEHDNSLANQIGQASAAAMEWLGDELNASDATTEEDEWLDPIFDAAQERWPQYAQPAAQVQAAAPVVLPEPLAMYDGEKWYANEEAAICSCADLPKLQKVYTEQQVRAMLARFVTAPLPEERLVMPEPTAYLHECRKKPELKKLSENRHEPDLLSKGFVPIPLFTATQVQAAISRGVAPGRKAVPVEPTENMRAAIDAARAAQGGA